MRDKIGGKAGPSLPDRRPNNADECSGDKVEDAGRRARHRRMVRAGEAIDAMGADTLVGLTGRQVRGGLAVMKAKLKSRCVIGCLCRERKSTGGEEEALRRNGVRHDDGEQRPAEALQFGVNVPHKNCFSIPLDPFELFLGVVSALLACRAAQTTKCNWNYFNSKNGRRDEGAA
jgi:hypothetical protein